MACKRLGVLMFSIYGAGEIVLGSCFITIERNTSLTLPSEYLIYYVESIFSKNLRHTYYIIYLFMDRLCEDGLDRVNGNRLRSRLSEKHVRLKKKILIIFYFIISLF